MRPYPLIRMIGMVLAGMLVWSAPAFALLTAHQNYDGCLTCHKLHGAGSGYALLAGIDTEATCLGCHGPLGIATEVAVHNPRSLAPDAQGYITCRECHGVHDNIGGNIKLVGYNWDPEIDPGKSTLFPVPTIRYEDQTTIPGSPVYRQVTFASSTDFNIDGTYPGPGVCQVCHSPNHNAGQNCTAACHGHSGGFSAAGGCTGCHDGNGTDALAVGPDSPHSETATGYSCADCHGSHGGGTIEVPNKPDVGIDYSLNGESGIALGSDVAVGATEAQICWNCHALEGVSEWGGNTDTNGVSFPNYDFGSLSGALAPAWVNAAGDAGATWSSANFSYKTETIRSTHAVEGTATGPGLDPVGTIRCSWCHDVHELALAPHDTKTGKPYLRGSWVGNPYREDGAPSNTAGGKPGDIADYSAYDVTGKFGAVPRGGPTYTALGGYFIDQNSNNPTADASMNSPDKFAGLCRLCHEGTAGTAGDGVWQATEIAALNEFGVPGDDWVANSNSHGRVVKGGGGLGAVNIFTTAKRHQTAWAAYTGNGSEGGNPVMAYRNARVYSKGSWSNVWGQGLRGTDSTAFQYSPPVDTSTRQYNYSNYAWGATVVVESGTTMTDSGIDASYHQFTCSKCHNPHASRLPRLMVTNCLDTRHNSWDDTFVTPASDTAGGGDPLSVENRSVSLSQVTSAQNCHRLADPAYPQARPQGTTTGGWNRVTPW